MLGIVLVVRPLCSRCKLLHTLTGRRFHYSTRRIFKIGAITVVTSVILGGLVVIQVARTLKEKLSHILHSLEKDSKQNAYIYLHHKSIISSALLAGAELQSGDPGTCFAWLQSHSKDAWTLLRLAKSSKRSNRLLGVESLAKSHNWTDAEYHSLAQACDTTTLIGLARSPGADKRFFLPPPRLPHTDASIQESFHQLLSSLPVNETDSCTHYFTNTALRDPQNAVAEETGTVWSFDGLGIKLAEEREILPESRRLFIDLQALYSFSFYKSHIPLIVEKGGLQLLQRIVNKHKNNTKILRAIARIIGNLALCDTIHEEVVQSGWVTILHEWSESDDLSLALNAARALANLDHDFTEDRLDDGMYIYHPAHRYSQPIYADVIFVHGLLGGPFRTWRQKDTPNMPKDKTSANKTPGTMDQTTRLQQGSSVKTTDPKEITEGQDKQTSNIENAQSDRQTSGAMMNTREPADAEYTYCWPKDWLAADCPHMRLLTVEYETHLSEWAPRCPYESEKRSLVRRSEVLMEKLIKAGVGSRPIIWVGHSMGGLLIKQMLVNARDSKDPSLTRIVEQTLGAVFYSVPHRGSVLANYSAQAHYILYPSVEVQELKQDSPMLLDLHEKFTSLMFEEGIPLLSFGETGKSALPLNVKVIIVPVDSSDPGFGEFHPVDADHLMICKPDSPSSALYVQTRDFVEHCILAHMQDSEPKAGIADDIHIHDVTSSVRDLLH